MLFKKKSDEAKKDSKFKSIFKRIGKSKKSLTIFIIACVAVAALVGYLLYAFVFSSEDAGVTNAEAKVTRGSIVNVIEGSGTIEAKAQYEVKYLNSVDVLEDFFEEGDYVTKDQILYQMDAEDIERNITKQQRNVERARLNYEEAQEAVSDLNVKSEINGVITNLYVSKGDKVTSGAKIADVVDKNTLLISIPFGAEDAGNIYVGQPAEVTILNSMTSLYGNVTHVGSGAYINNYGVEVTDVEIEVSNPGAVTEGTTATAVVGSYACYDTAQLEYSNSKTITAKTSGEVVSISKKKGDNVSKGTVVLTLESDSSDKSVRDARISYEDALSSLEQLMETRDDATIRSEIDGKVIQKNIKAGEILDSNTSSTMAIIADLSSLKFSMSIDELDISKISVGQEVSITADALTGQSFKGTVTNVSIVGTAYQGVTSYPVTITIDNAEQTALIPGMNVEAQIVIDSVNDVLRVPVSALRNGNLVIVKDDGTFADPLEMQIPNMAGKDKSTKQDKNEEDSAKPTDLPDNTETQPKASEEGSDNGNRKPRDGAIPPKGAPVQNENKQGDRQKPATGRGQMSEADIKEMQEKQKERMKSIIESLDVPDGYTVVRVQTGLNDGTFVEIKEVEGSLKEGDTVLVPVVINTNRSTQQATGMPGGMGSGMPGGMGSGMPGRFPSGGGYSGNRQSGGFGGNRQTGR